MLLHLGQRSHTLGAERREIAASLADLRSQLLRVHAVAEVEVSGDLLRLSRRECAGANRVAPAAIANSSALEVNLGVQRVSVNLKIRIILGMNINILYYIY